MMKKKINNFFLIVLALLLVVSCDSKRVFDSYVSIPKNYWKKENTIQFQFSVSDTISKRNLFINIRNNNNYPFSNLFLITKLQFPNKKEIVDTLEYKMTDASGKFLGKGFSNIKENKLFYKENKNFPISGFYTLNISQAMRKNGETNGILSLKGITDVGFRIEKIE